MTRTVFLDRDGTLNRDTGYLGDPSKLEMLPGAAQAVARLHEAGFRIVVTTNQSGIARGFYGESDLARVHERMHEQLNRLPLAYLHCPHHPSPAPPDSSLPAGGSAGCSAGGYAVECSCRKPKAGLVARATSLLAPFGVSTRGAVTIGDSARDLLMTADFEATRILVRCGKPVEEQRRKLAAAHLAPDAETADLAEAVDWLLARG
ncbi:MAG: D-glycero-alpha-D-manno-heptose-1,7-bisphosphate 7-phosphatase [Planctomycetota bacterium]